MPHFYVDDLKIIISYQFWQAIRVEYWKNIPFGHFSPALERRQGSGFPSRDPRDWDDANILGWVILHQGLPWYRRSEKMEADLWPFVSTMFVLY